MRARDDLAMANCRGGGGGMKLARATSPHLACAVADRLLDNFQTTQSFSSRQHHVTSIQQYAWDARACILHSSFLTIYLPYIYQKVD
jgi:hypothetical protein